MQVLVFRLPFRKMLAFRDDHLYSAGLLIWNSVSGLTWTNGVMQYIWTRVSGIPGWTDDNKLKILLQHPQPPVQQSARLLSPGLASQHLQ